MLPGVLALALALVVPPAPTARVNDYASLLSAGDRGRLEALLAEREQATGAQMVIAIFRSLEGENLEDFSIRLAQQWRIGQKGLDNGVILLVFVQDRKVRLEVGYGLEPVVTDAVAGRIITEVIAPRFREQRYTAGLEGAVIEIFNRVASAKGGKTLIVDRRPGVPLPFVGFVAVLLLVAIVLLQEIFSARRFVGRNAYTAGRRGWDVPIIMAPPWWGRGGGWGGGGGFSGGGGSFGGGGASGGW